MIQIVFAVMDSCCLLIQTKEWQQNSQPMQNSKTNPTEKQAPSNKLNRREPGNRIKLTGNRYKLEQ